MADCFFPVIRNSDVIFVSYDKQKKVSLRSFSLPFFLQSRGSVDHKVPFIIEADDLELGDDSRHAQQRKLPLFPDTNSPVHQPCLSSLLGEELRHINALRLCRSPVQGGRGLSPSPQPYFAEDLSPSPLPGLTGDSGLAHRPAKLLMPSLPCVSPLNLSPR